MHSTKDNEKVHLYTCVEFLPLPVLEWPSIHLFNVDATKFFGSQLCGMPSLPTTNGMHSLGIALETNEDGALIGLVNPENGSLRFQLEHVDFIFGRSTKHDEGPQLYDQNIERFVLSIRPTVRKSGAEWRAIVQTRIYVASSSQLFQMATADLFEMGTGSASLELQIEPEIQALKIEFRFIYQSYRELPTFNDGDLSVFFSPTDQNPVSVDKALMALYAPRLVNVLKDLPPDVSLSLPYEIEREQFVEMLYRIYTPNNPLASTNFAALCSAATKLCSKLLLWPLCQHIVNDSQLDFEHKVQKAAHMGLEDAVRQLCYDAVKSGQWAKVQQEKGFDPRKFFGQQIYSKLVLPAVIEATKDKNSRDSTTRARLYEQKYPSPMPVFDNLYEASNPYNIQLLIDGKMLYVNAGVLQINGCMDKMNRMNDSIYAPRVSADLKVEMEQGQLRLEQVVIPVLHLLYGVTNRVNSPLVRSCLIFANDHGMHHVVDRMEELLMHEFVDGPTKLLSHFLLAEKYHLKNLERRSLWQLEFREYQEYGLDMIAMPDYNKLSPLMKLNVEDRMCSGWSIFEKKLAKKIPSNVTTFLLKLLKKPLVEPIYPYEEKKLDDLQTVVMAGDSSFDQLSDYEKSLTEDEADLETAVV